MLSLGGEYTGKTMLGAAVESLNPARKRGQAKFVRLAPTVSLRFAETPLAARSDKLADFRSSIET
ncbi:MAG: hypothetical protein JO223_16075 [Hyphomicrobiales bacterium]|nr:hypothetical protein [Hyphomicrobiales bacterium]